MPELPFVQVMAVAAVVAFAAVIASMLAGARRGVRAGRLLLHGSLLGVAAVFAACLLWGASTGDLGRFNAAVGRGAWLQMGLFFGIVYGTGYRFVDAYLTDKRAETKEAGDA